MEDGQEVKLGLNPLLWTDNKDDWTDRDLDGIPDAVEDKNENGKYDLLTETNFAAPDNDGDGLCDGSVAAVGSTADFDGNPLTKGDNFSVTADPLDGRRQVRDGNGKVICWAGEDWNNDGTYIGQEAGANGDPDTLADNESNPMDWDSDNDNSSDAFEVIGLKKDGQTRFGGAQCLDPNFNDQALDADDDLLTNQVERNGPWVASRWHNQPTNDGFFVQRALRHVVRELHRPVRC